MLKAYDKAGEISYSLGAFPTVELIKRRREDIESIVLHSSLRMTDELEKILFPVRDITVVDDRSISRIAKKGNVYMAGVFRKRYENFGSDTHVTLVQPSDEGNLGTIMRTMLGFGIRKLAIVGQGCADAYNPKTVRASMGAIFSLSISVYPHWEDYAAAHTEKKLLFMLDDRSVTLGSIAPEAPFGLVFGNEGSGLPRELAETGIPVIIRHSKDIDSLNLPQAVAIGLYETTKHIFCGDVNK